MRRHVQSMFSLGGDLVIGPGKGKTFRGHARGIIQVDEVMHRAGMLRVVLGHPLRQGDGLAGYSIVVSRVGEFGFQQDRMRGESQRFRIVRITGCVPSHGGGVRPQPLGEGTLGVERFDRGSEGAFARVTGFGQPRFPARSQPCEGRSRRRDILLPPQDVARGQGLAPIGKREPRIGALGLSERLGRPVVLETVEERDSGEECGLSGCRPGIGKDDFPECDGV